MKKALWILIVLSLVLGISAAAVALDHAPMSATSSASALSASGEYVPFWFDTTTRAICYPSNGPMTCTTTRDCQLYFGPNLVCDNPSGTRCGGSCR